MTKRTEKTLQALSPKGRWITLNKEGDAFTKAKDGGRPIRVLHPSGSFKVIFNLDKMPEDKEVRHRATA
jgi:hypothetical protein